MLPQHMIDIREAGQHVDGGTNFLSMFELAMYK
jgi:hypothetical protein